MASAADLRLVTPEEFLAINFGPDLKAELSDGVIRMMAGGSREHARVQSRFFGFLSAALDGSACSAFASDAAVRSAGYSIRYPDVVVDCAPDQGLETELAEQVLLDPRVIVEVLSPGSRKEDEGQKLHEYRRMPGLRTIVFADPATRSVRVIEQIGTGQWYDTGDVVGADARFWDMRLTMTNAEIFGRS